MGDGRQSLINPSDVRLTYGMIRYEAPNGEIHTCGLDAAQLWLQAGYFTSQMKFVVGPRDADVRSGEWKIWTLDGLIERNGRSTPFLMVDDEEKRREGEKIGVLSEELTDLNKRRLNVLTSMQSLQNRLVAAQTERLRIEERIDSSAESIAHYESQNEWMIDTECLTQEISSPLMNISTGRDELFGNVASQISDYISSLAEDTVVEAIERGEESVSPVDSTNLKADSSSCATALDENSQTIQSIGTESGGFPDVSMYAGLPLMESGPHPGMMFPPPIGLYPHPFMFDPATHAAAAASQQQAQMQGPMPLMMMTTFPIHPGAVHYHHHPTMVNQRGLMTSQEPDGFVQLSYPPAAAVVYPLIYPPPGVDPFALLKSCDGARRKLGGDIWSLLKTLNDRIYQCDRMRLIQQTGYLFDNSNMSECTLCRVPFLGRSRLADVMSHICSCEHAEATKGVVCADAFDFWWNAAETVGDLSPDTISFLNETCNEPSGCMQQMQQGMMPMQHPLSRRDRRYIAKCQRVNEKQLEPAQQTQPEDAGGSPPLQQQSGSEKEPSEGGGGETKEFVDGGREDADLPSKPLHHPMEQYVENNGDQRESDGFIQLKKRRVRKPNDGGVKTAEKPSLPTKTEPIQKLLEMKTTAPPKQKSPPPQPPSAPIPQKVVSKIIDQSDKRPARREWVTAPPTKSSIKSNSFIVNTDSSLSSTKPVKSYQTTTLNEVKVPSPTPVRAESSPSFNYFLVGNSLTERDKDADFAKKLLKAAEKILRFEQDQVFPIYDIDPFDVLYLFPAPVGQEQDVANPYVAKLQTLFNKRDPIRFTSLVGHLFVEKEIRCVVCGKLIGNSPNELIQHISAGLHVRKMKQRKLVYPLEALAFWMYTLRMALCKDPETKNKRKKKRVVFQQFNPPVPSVVVKSEKETEKRVKPIDSHSPLAVLSHYRDVPNPCQNVRLVASFMYRKLSGVDIARLRKDDRIQEMFMDGRTANCEVCPRREKFVFDCPDEIIAHVVNSTHVKKLIEDGGQVDMDAIFFWIDAMSRSSKNKDEKHAPPRSSLNRLLSAGMYSSTSPIALLMQCRGVSDPCPYYGRAMAVLETKREKCDIDLFNKAMRQYFGEPLQCGACVEYKKIRSGSDFITHVVSDDHIANATRSDGQASKSVLRFWLDALCDAGAAIKPLEQLKVSQLFG